MRRGMIVYGDPSHTRTLHEVCVAIQTRLDQLPRQAGRLRLDELRSLLIEAGQLEQGAEDAPEGVGRFLPTIRSVTDSLATGFAREFEATGDGHSRRTDDVREVLLQLQSCPDTPLAIKVPEGFAFYCLFPEQYAVAAEPWSRRNAHRASARVAVIGIRSIGTSLSALVSRKLKSLGWDVRRTTVRPTGHPFERRTSIDCDWLKSAELAIVVDEGPGASGSSMASVAQALVDAGIDPHAISFFPGHNREPGPKASEQVRRWWASVPRYAVPMHELRWGGRSLTQILADSTQLLLKSASPIERVDDLSGGLWRRFVYRHESDWPAACALLERAKYRFTSRDGQSMLWKFAGLTCPATDRAPSSATDEWNPRRVAKAMGFVALPWVAGTPMRAADADPEFIRQMGRYIAAAAGPELSDAELERGLGRLQEMLECNVRELLGDDYAAAARRSAEVARKILAGGAMRSYGDGRMAPCEWIRSTSPQATKVDSFGHDCDHTIIGRQPWLWDAAGAAVEWGLDEQAEAALIENSALPANPTELRTFYRAAYAAFRAALCNLCSSACGDDANERQRLDQAQAAYLTRLKSELDCFGR